MKITSPDFKHMGSIPSRFTCDGQNSSPTLFISEVAPETVSLALLVDDPDAPVGDWVHWLTWNIDPETSVIREGVMQLGGMGLNDFKKKEWGGPCPPSGVHRYFFKLYALDAVLDLSEGSTKKEFLAAINEHIVDEAQLIGLYQRQK